MEEKKRKKRKGVYKEEGVSKVWLECSIVWMKDFLWAIIVNLQGGSLPVWKIPIRSKKEKYHFSCGCRFKNLIDWKYVILF